VSVAVEGQKTAGVEGGTCEIVIDVLARRVAVDFDRDVMARRFGEDPWPVRGYSGSRRVLTAPRMPQDVNARRANAAQHPIGLIRGQPKRGVRSGHDDLETAQLILFHVNCPIRENICFDALDQPETAAVLFVQPIDLDMLLRKRGHRHTAGNRQAVRVIGNGAVLIASLEAARDDLVERLAAVAPDRVQLEVASIVTE